MLILIIIGLLGLIFGLSLILYFTSKDIIGDDVNISNSTEDYDELDAGSCDKATQQDSAEQKD